MDTQRIVLAFNGNATSCSAVTWLIDTHRAEVAALIVDVGQSDDLEEVRARALNCGAVRAHVVDRCDGFVREMIVPAAAAGVPLDDEALRQLAHPVIAAALVEVAAIENADAVAYASAHGSLGEQIRAVHPTIRVLSPTREWVNQHSSPAAAHSQRHLLLRSPVATATSAAQLAIGFASGIPVSVNGVTMGLRELIESVSLIGGQYAAGLWEASPALGVLQAAYRASGGRGAVTLQLQAGSLVIVDDRPARPTLVSQA